MQTYQALTQPCRTGSFVYLTMIKGVSIFSGGYDTYKALMLVVRAGWDVNQWRVW